MTTIARFRMTLTVGCAVLLLTAGRSHAQPLVADPRSPMGARVRITLMQGEAEPRRSVTQDGELLGVDSLQLWLRRAGTPTALPRVQVGAIRVRVHQWGRKRAWTIGGIGAGISAAGMTAACSHQSSSCGAVFPVVALAWLAVAGLSGELMEANSWEPLSVNEWSVVARYARYPQGVPASARVPRAP